MKRIIALLVFCLLSVGCAPENNKPYRGSRVAIPATDKDKVAKFICDCTKAGMPTGSWHGSSPEDVVQKCKDSAFQIYGVPELGTWYKEYSDGMLTAFIPDSKQ